NKRQTVLRARLEDLQRQHSSKKISPNEILYQIVNLQHGIQKKEKDLQVSRENAMFRTVEDVDIHIRRDIYFRNLEEQVESTRQEIDHVRHIRKTVESFQADSDTLDAERAAVEELKKQLDDLEAKATSERHDVIKVKEDEIETDLNANSKVFQGRLRRQLFSEPRQSTSWFQEDNNERYYAKFNEERHAEWQRAQGEAEDCA
ncbi:hypothetical protein DFH94DRAFT_612331, partial [Russula ochroleuca]